MSATHNQKVWLKEGEHYDTDTFTKELYICPNCKYNNVFCGYMYCPHCGINIKWELKSPNKTIKGGNNYK